MGTRYRYFTSDGGPPNGGAPPGAPSNPPGFGPFGCPPANGRPTFYLGPGVTSQPYTCHLFSPPGSAPSVICHPPSGAPPGAIYIGPHIPSAAGPTLIGSAGPPPYSNAPPPGGRVKGLLPRFPDRNSGYIFPKNNCTFHIVKGSRKPWDWQGLLLDFNVMHAPTNMKLEEFIEQVGAVERAPANTPRDRIGVVEVLESGNGTWLKGTEFMLGDDDGRMNMTLQEVGWDNDRGEAGRSKPVILVFLP
jgi:hypothetical protein